MASRYLDKHNVANSGKGGQFVRKGSKSGGGAAKSKKPGFFARRKAASDARGEASDRDSVKHALESGKSKRVQDSKGRVFKLSRGKVVRATNTGGHRGHSAASQRALNKELSTPAARKKTKNAIAKLRSSDTKRRKKAARRK